MARRHSEYEAQGFPPTQAERAVEQTGQSLPPPEMFNLPDPPLEHLPLKGSEPWRNEAERYDRITNRNKDIRERRALDSYRKERGVLEADEMSERLQRITGGSGDEAYKALVPNYGYGGIPDYKYSGQDRMYYRGMFGDTPARPSNEYDAEEGEADAYSLEKLPKGSPNFDRIKSQRKRDKKQRIKDKHNQRGVRDEQFLETVDRTGGNRDDMDYWGGSYSAPHHNYKL